MIAPWMFEEEHSKLFEFKKCADELNRKISKNKPVMYDIDVLRSLKVGTCTLQSYQTSDRLLYLTVVFNI